MPCPASRSSGSATRSSRAWASVGDAVALVGHLDTVPPWEGHEPRLEGTRVIGRGAADMKGGDAAILAVLEHCARSRRSGRVRVLRPRGGPATARTASTPCSRSRGCSGSPAFAFVGEPTGCDVHAGCVGVVNADLVFHGRTAHSARPWEGDNAVLRAVPFLDARGAGCAAARRGRGPDVPRHALHHADPRRRGAQRRARSRRDRAQRALRPGPRGGGGARRGRGSWWRARAS